MTLHPSSSTAQRILRTGARHVTRGTAARTQSAKQFFLDNGKRMAPKTLVYASKLQKPTYSTPTLPKKFGGGDSGSSTSNHEFECPTPYKGGAAAESDSSLGEMTFKVMSPSRTVQTFESRGVDSAATSATFEYDYDRDNLHMPPSQTTSMDYEDNFGCDSLGQDDVMDVRDARRQWDAEMKVLEEPESILGGAGANWYESSGDSGVGADFVETEEDWEILHATGTARARKVDVEDGDVVIDW